MRYCSRLGGNFIGLPPACRPNSARSRGLYLDPVRTPLGAIPSLRLAHNRRCVHTPNLPTSRTCNCGGPSPVPTESTPAWSDCRVPSLAPFRVQCFNGLAVILHEHRFQRIDSHIFEEALAVGADFGDQGFKVFGLVVADSAGFDTALVGTLGHDV